MRIRTIKPGFWNDEDLATLPADSYRLVFVGLWMEADDSGLFEWRPKAIAADLYPFAPGRGREQKIEKALAALEAIGAVRRLDCGRHGIVENLRRHQHLPGRTATPVEKDHVVRCLNPRISAAIGEHPQASANIGEGREGNGREGIYSAHAREETTNGRISEEQAAELRGILADPSSAEVAKKAATKTLERYGYALVAEGENG